MGGLHFFLLASATMVTGQLYVAKPLQIRGNIKYFESVTIIKQIYRISYSPFNITHFDPLFLTLNTVRSKISDNTTRTYLTIHKLHAELSNLKIFSTPQHFSFPSTTDNLLTQCTSNLNYNGKYFQKQFFDSLKTILKPFIDLDPIVDISKTQEQNHFQSLIQALLVTYNYKSQLQAELDDYTSWFTNNLKAPVLTNLLAYTNRTCPLQSGLKDMSPNIVDCYFSTKNSYVCSVDLMFHKNPSFITSYYSMPIAGMTFAPKISYIINDILVESNCKNHRLSINCINPLQSKECTSALLANDIKLIANTCSLKPFIPKTPAENFNDISLIHTDRFLPRSLEKFAGYSPILLKNKKIKLDFKFGSIEFRNNIKTNDNLIGKYNVLDIDFKKLNILDPLWYLSCLALIPFITLLLVFVKIVKRRNERKERKKEANYKNQSIYLLRNRK
jgi:hypothetical protein